ncbi:MAG: SDR family oxidoreductase, partial [Acetobacteraceae bacterium]|nr:SDR family oxidoreductase [Acetobacteraceae bacterium]
CPGYTETELVERSAREVAERTGREPAEVKATFARGNPQGRLVLPDEVAAAVVFLCGPHSAAMTGQAIAVAGGEVM